MGPRIEVMTVVAVITPTSRQVHHLPDYFNLEDVHPDVHIVATDWGEIDWSSTEGER